MGLFRVVLKLWIICFAEFCRNKFLQKKLCFFPLQIFKCFVQSSVWPKVSRKAITSCLWRGQLKWPGKERKRWRRKCNYVISSPLFLNLTKNQFWPKTQNELEWVWRARSHLKTVQTTFMKTVSKCEICAGYGVYVEAIDFIWRQPVPHFCRKKNKLKREISAGYGVLYVEVIDLIWKLPV